jgi:hypothetical protein
MSIAHQKERIATIPSNVSQSLKSRNAEDDFINKMLETIEFGPHENSP